MTYISLDQGYFSDLGSIGKQTDSENQNRSVGMERKRAGMPIMYAAIMVLPCPGSKACKAPRVIAPKYKNNILTYD